MLRGFWRDLIPFLNSLHADHLVLEFARRGYDELEVLSDLNPKIGLGIGVIDIKDNEVESPDLIASRIEHIAKVLGPETAALCASRLRILDAATQCGGPQDARTGRGKESVRRTSIDLSRGRHGGCSYLRNTKS